MTQSTFEVPLNPSPKLNLPVKRYRIGELVSFTGLSRQTIHNYTHWGLIREVAWTAGGHRLYDEGTFNRLEQIISLKRTNTIDEIRQRLEASAKEQ